MMKFNQFTSFILVVFLGSFVFSCGQMTAKDDGLDSKTIEEASGTSGETENSSDGSGEDSGLDNSTDNTTSSTAGFTIGTISGNNTESGGTATFTVKLNTQPSADVLIAVSSSDTTEGTVRPSSLSFTSSNYNSAQTVTVTGIDDSAVDGNKNFRIILAAASSSDSNYNGLNPDDVSVTNTDDETAGFTISSISENTTEAGGTATFTTKLNSQPSADVSIAVSSSDTTEGTVNPLSLTFTNSNWSADQTVTVTGVDDSATDGNQSYTVILAAATSSDSNYNGLNPTDVSVTNIDNEWSGIKQFGTSEWDRGNGLGLDPSGNVYVAGQTSGGLDGNVNTGLGDIFLVKYNSSGTKQWTKQLGTSATEEVTGASVDSGGNVYITGYTRGGLDGNTSAGNKDIFLLKYNSSGVKQWTKQIGTSSDDGGQGVAIDSNGNIYVTGYTYGGLDGNTNLGSYDVILLKYNSSGTKQWTQQLGTTSGESGSGVAVDSNGNVYVAGSTLGGLDGNVNTGLGDIFLVKYNASGTKQWTKQLGTSAMDVVRDPAIDSSGDVYVAGQTAGGLDGNTNVGSYDIFLVKYNSSGTKQWTKQIGTSSDDLSHRIAIDSNGNIYVTGYTYGGLDGNTNIGSYDVILLKYNSSGTKQWTQQLGTSSGDIGYDIEVDSIGDIYVSGQTQGAFDGNTNSGGLDAFIVKYNSSGVMQ